MWQCPSCGEQHEDSFETCWSCGTDTNGAPNPDFRVSEPAAAEDQLPETAAESQPPVLRLPTITYFAIPVCLLMNLAILIAEFPANGTHPDTNPLSSPAKIAVFAITMLFVAFPLVFEAIRGYLASVSRKPRPQFALSDLFCAIVIFRLPEPLRRSYRWFGRVYYGSIIAYFLATIVMSVWLVCRSVQAG
jgi:hypothetical protein